MQKIKDIDAILVAHFRANKTFPGKCALSLISVYRFISLCQISEKLVYRRMGECTDE